MKLEKCEKIYTSVVVLGEFMYGKLKAELQTVGNIVPENDMWIVATALANNMTVVTQDKHFGHIPGLNVIKI